MTQYCSKVLLKPLSMTIKMHRFLNFPLYCLLFFCITWIVFCIIYIFFCITWIVFCIIYTSFVFPELSSVLFTLLLYHLNCLLYYLHSFELPELSYVLFTSSFVLPELSSVLFTLLLYFLNCLLYYLLFFFCITWIVFCIIYTLLNYLNCLLYYLHFFFCITWLAFPGALVPDRSPHSGHSKKNWTTHCILGIF